MTNRYTRKEMIDEMTEEYPDAERDFIEDCLDDLIEHGVVIQRGEGDDAQLVVNNFTALRWYFSNHPDGKVGAIRQLMGK